MVRINIINPKKLTDQHLVAEYLEILMLVSYIKKHPVLEDIPKQYKLGKGHIKFFKNKLLYIKNRFESIKKEMKNRSFKTNKTLSISSFSSKYKNNWKPTKKDRDIIKTRLMQKIRKKPSFYRYYRKKRKKEFLLDMLK